MDVPLPGKITDPKHCWIEDLDIEWKIQESNLLPENKDLIGRFISDACIGKTILKRTKKRAGKALLVNCLQDLKKLDKELQNY